MRTLVGIVALILALALPPTASTPAQPKPMKIGFLDLLTGGAAQVGRDMLNGAAAARSMEPRTCGHGPWSGRDHGRPASRPASYWRTDVVGLRASTTGRRRLTPPGIGRRSRGGQDPGDAQQYEWSGGGNAIRPGVENAETCRSDARR
jgi:hypothetical protein